MSDNDSSSIYEAIEADIESYLQILGNGELQLERRHRQDIRLKNAQTWRSHINICCLCNCSYCQSKPAKPIRLLTLIFKGEIIYIEINYNIIQQTLNIQNENFTEELYNIIKQEYRVVSFLYYNRFCIAKPLYHNGNLRNRRSQA